MRTCSKSGLTAAASALVDIVAPGSPVVELYGRNGSDVYDQITRGDGNEIREILHGARTTSGSILELAAGSGRLTLPLARLGRRTVAFDNSERMLEILRGRLSATDTERIITVHGDMADFDLGERFGLVVLGTTSLTLLSPEKRRSCLSHVSRHLDADGVFLVSVFAASDMLSDRATEVAIIPSTTGNDDVFVFTETLHASDGYRDVSIIRFRRAEDGGAPTTTTFVSRVGLVSESDLRAELNDAGLMVQRTVPVKTGADTADHRRLVMLECTRNGARL